MEEEFTIYRSLPPHKNVVSMVDSWDDNVKGRSYLVMDHMSGGTLDRLIRKAWSTSIENTMTINRTSAGNSGSGSGNSNNMNMGTGLPFAQIRVLFRDALNGLNHLHKNGVYHRDIKPDNLMLTSDLTVCVSDFGTATFEPSTRGIGAPGFQPPEVILTGTSPDSSKIDTWAMGVTLHMMVTGMHPFGTQASSIYQLIERIGNEVYVPPETLPTQLKDLLVKILNPNSDERLSVDDILRHPWMLQTSDDDVNDDVNTNNNNINENDNEEEEDDDEKSEVSKMEDENEDENNNNNNNNGERRGFVKPDLLSTVFTSANIKRLQEEFNFDEQDDEDVHMEEVLDVEIDGDSIRVKKKRKSSRFLCCGSCCIIC